MGLQKFTREEIISQLQTSVCEIFFKKKNGAIREMICTLDPSRAPGLQLGRISEASNPANRTISPTVVPVWDIEKMAWRSFRINSVIFFRQKKQPPPNVK